MRSSYLVAGGLVIALGLWMASGDISGEDPPEVPVAVTPSPSDPMKVRVRQVSAESVTRRVVVQGQLEPWRAVELRAETQGLVAEVLVPRGSRVSAGDPLVRLDRGDRESRLARAEASVNKSRSVLKASRRLASKNLQSDEIIRAQEADLAAAEAELAAVLLDIDRTEIRAPFDGVVESRPVEVGTLLERGDVVLSLVDDTRLKATAQVPQSDVSNLQPDQRVVVRLMNDETLEGRLSFISRLADSSTRSFRVEVEVGNPKQQFAAGISAVLVFPVESVLGHFVSPSLLVLDDVGRVGIITVDESDTAVFYPVELVRAETGGAWVTGLPGQVRLVTFGQGFIRPGERVIPINESEG